MCGGLILLLLLLASAPAGADPSITKLDTKEELDHFLKHFKPRFNKAIFFTQMGTSSLANKLVEEFEGRVAIGIVKADTGASYDPLLVLVAGE
jgi:hypothetical protein